jgi:AcrR family transcriptional regulator
MSAPSESPGPRGAVTRQRILAVARELFSERGFERTTVREIARRVGITDPALYYYFKSKRLIMEGVLIQPPVLAEGRMLAERPAPGSRPQLVEHLFGLWVAWAEQSEMIRILVREQMARTPTSLEFRRNAVNITNALVVPPLQAVYGPDVAVIAQSLYTLLSGIMWDATLTYGEHCPEVVRQALFRTRMRQLIELALPATPRDRSDGGTRS